QVVLPAQRHRAQCAFRRVVVDLDAPVVQCPRLLRGLSSLICSSASVLCARDHMTAVALSVSLTLLPRGPYTPCELLKGNSACPLNRLTSTGRGRKISRRL